MRRRAEDSHTRKAAIELEGLREALRLAGYRRARDEEEERAKRTERERQTETEQVNERRSRTERVEQTIDRVMRPLRELRVGRLAPVQRVAQDMVQSLRRWLGHRLGLSEEQARRQTLAQRIDPPRQSRGMRI